MAKLNSKGSQSIIMPFVTKAKTGRLGTYSFFRSHFPRTAADI